MLGLTPAVPGVGEFVVGPVAARLVGSAGAVGGLAPWGAELVLVRRFRRPYRGAYEVWPCSLCGSP